MTQFLYKVSSLSMNTNKKLGLFVLYQLTTKMRH